MKLLKQCAVVGLVAGMFVSCSDDNPWGVNSGEGALRLSIEASGDVEAAVPAVRAISADVVPPPASAFKVSMVKDGGGYSKTWSSIEEFEKEESFPVGNYTLSASYGDEKSQGRVLASEEGYEHAWYYGETSVAIREGETSQVQLSVAVANSIVVIEYTDAFKKFFKNYHTMVQPAGGDAIDLGDNEAMNYVQPGDLNVTISATQQNGKTLTLNPATYTLEPKHMYKMRYNIYQGEIGDAVLSITFDESLSTEEITVNLSDELENTRAPQVTAIGFEPGAELVTLAGTPYQGEAKFSAVADGGISKAVLTFSSDSYFPSYISGGRIDLCAATPAQRAAMEADGIKALGFYDKRGTMGQLDLSEFFRKLPEGTHSITFQVSDQFTQTHEPVGCSLACIPVDMSAAGGEVVFGDDYADITISYNGPDPIKTNPFSFKVINRSGIGGESCEIISTKLKDGTRADYPSHDYVYRLRLPYVADDTATIGVYFNNAHDPSMKPVVKFIFPENQYQENMEYDVMATQLRWRTNFTDTHRKNLFEKRIRVFVDGTEYASTYDSGINAYVVAGLTPGQQHDIRTTVQAADSPTVFGSAVSLSTEAAAPVPNGDFSSTRETINTNIQVGGQWTVMGSTLTTTCDMRYSEPDGGWASVNSKTFYDGSSARNTWFMVASTYMGDGNSVILRSVAYDHAGNVPAKTGSAFSTKYYCTNYPDKIAERAAGELFLGSYSFDGSSETRNEGYDFVSRPTSLSFSYKYLPYKSDEGFVEMKVLASDGSVLVAESGTLSESGSARDFTLKMPEYKFGVKPAKLLIKFMSSTQNPVLTKENSEIDLSADSKAAGGKLSGVNSTHTFSAGSELTISNLRFEY